jgi:hypothetical protein
MYVILYEMRKAANITEVSQYILGCVTFFPTLSLQLHESSKQYYINVHQVLGLCTF